MVSASSRITEKSLELIRNSIAETGGSEVMFCGSVNEEGIIDSVIVAARGNDDSVAALEAFMEKGDVIIHNHPGGNLKPSSADLRIASLLGAQGIGFFIIDNEAENLYAAAEPLITKKNKKIDTEKLVWAISPGGVLSTLFPYYEARDSQIEMLASVAECFNEKKLTIAEAGTGVGKSIAYLLPAFQWAIDNEERVVISTNTINLQHQLIEKDIPLVKKILGTDKEAALIKGRSNYLCLRKYYEALNENSLFAEDGKGIELLREWVVITKTGDKADLPMLPDYSVWNDVCSESDYCLGLYCAYREKCFVIKARKNAASASVLVVNHHLLFADLSARNEGAGFNGTAVLPKFSYTIFDEAHNIEASATSLFSYTLSKGFIFKSFKQLYSRNRGRIWGIHSFIMDNAGAHEKKAAEIPHMIADTINLFEELEKEAENLLMGKQNLKIERTPLFENLFEKILAFKKQLSGIYGILDDVAQNIDVEPENDPRVYELFLIKARLKELIFKTEILLDSDSDTYVNWIEKGRTTSFISTPLDVSEILQETVYNKIKSIAFTSATLSIKKQFDFWKKRVGLLDCGRETTENSFDSPFDYSKQVMIAVPTDMVSPQDPKYAKELSDFALNMILMAEGGALILFTSYSMLIEVYNNVKDKITGAGITLLRQGEIDRFKIQKIFNEDVKSVLFATDSFWEGIDSPGDTLKLLIICRLPFKVPTDPVIKAKLDKIEKEGGRSFTDYSLPEAVIKLKQGFGRLMRRKTDRGVVVITDNRIITKSYGEIFLSSLPETVKCIGTKTVIKERAEDFLFSKK